MQIYIKKKKIRRKVELCETRSLEITLPTLGCCGNLLQFDALKLSLYVKSQIFSEVNI